MLTVAEAAEVARVSESLIYQFCEERRLTHYRAGGNGKRGKILIAREDLEGFMASIKVEARAVK